jgi:hypothetical protein
MKYLILFSALTALSVQAQNFSPLAGAIGTQGAGTTLNQGSPSGQIAAPVSPSAIGADTVIPGNTNPSTTIPNNPSTTLGGPTTLGGQPIPLGQGTTIDQTNTAPTPIPNDTSLIITPSNDPLIQSQEENLSPANSGTGTGGTGTLDSDTNTQVPFTP